MPNRVIKESIRTSPNLNACSVEARDLFIRLLTAADDYGRFEADPGILRAACYPRLLDQTTTAQVERWRDELALPERDCIRLYEVRGRLYGNFPTWFDHQRPARSKSKHPPPPRKTPPQDVVVQPPEDHNAPQPAAIRSNPQRVVRDSGVVSRESRVVSRESRSVSSLRAADDGDKPSVTHTPESFLVSEDLLAMWTRAYPALDIRGEVHRAHAWTLANPANKKSNWHRFLVGWLKREQDHAPARLSNQGRPGQAGSPHMLIRPAMPDDSPLSPEQVEANRTRLATMTAELAGKKAMR